MNFWAIKGFMAAGVAAAVMFPVAARAAGAVTFELRDAPGDTYGGVNETLISRGGSFSVDAWIHAPQDLYVGVDFKVRLLEYATSSPYTFTITGVSRAGSSFTFANSTDSAIIGNRLDPLNASDLGGYLDDVDDYRTGSEFLVRLTFAADVDLPLGTYTIAGDGAWSQWYEWGEGPWDFTTLIPYTVHVIPEPGEYALMGALGLLGFGIWRRYQTRARG